MGNRWKYISPRACAAALLARCVPTVHAITMSFPKSREEIQLDLVGLLTVIGEASMAMHSQCITISKFSLLPRVLPAPQAFLQPNRPSRLPPNENAMTVGVMSGNVRRHLNYMPDLLHDIDSYPRLKISFVRVERAEGHPPNAGILKASNKESSEPDHIPPNINPRFISPLTILAALGVVISIGLIVGAIFAGDPMAIIALALLSITSTLTGIGSYWQVKLDKRGAKRDVPPADLIIKGGNGSFILVKCNEEVARELYFGQEECDYKLSTNGFRVCAGAGTFTLMAAVVALANCTWWMQASIGLTYIVMNSFYWIAAVLPTKLNWDFSVYKVTEEEPAVECGSYTQCLWELIRRTKTINWAQGTDLAPKSLAWDRWLEEAEENANANNLEWDFQNRLTYLLSAKPQSPSRSSVQLESFDLEKNLMEVQEPEYIDPKNKDSDGNSLVVSVARE